MKLAEERSRSVWMDVSVAPGAQPITTDLEVDVVVVGAGIAGLSIGYELLLRGRSVAILDRGPDCRRHDVADNGTSGAGVR